MSPSPTRALCASAIRVRAAVRHVARTWLAGRLAFQAHGDRRDDPPWNSRAPSGTLGIVACLARVIAATHLTMLRTRCRAQLAAFNL
jgi:hypothetical protein